jgi:GAF domain-containing protein
MNAPQLRLPELSHQVDAGRLTLAEVAEAEAKHIQSKIRCRRVTMWTVAGAPGQRVLQHLATFDAAHGAVVTTPLEVEEGRKYFNALVGKGFCACADTFVDPVFAAIKQCFLEPRQIRALMSAYIGINGIPWGTITCLHDEPRQWRPLEIAALKRFATEISIRHARRRRREGDASHIGRITRGSMTHR